MDNETIVIAITRLEEQVVSTRKDISDHHIETMKILKKNEGRINSLEHSRTIGKGILTLLVAGLTFIGWDAVAKWFI